MKSTSAHYRNLPGEIKIKIRSLTLRDSGFLYLLNREKVRGNTPHMILLWEGRQLIAWNAYFCEVNECHFYVRVSERRKGVASKIFEMRRHYLLENEIPEIRVLPHDPRSICFFKKMRKQHKEKIRVVLARFC